MYRPQEAGCDDSACATEVAPNWVFDSAAVQRGTATFLSLPQVYRQGDPRDADWSAFTTAPWAVRTIGFAALTGTLANALDDLAQSLLATPLALFPVDWQRTVDLSQMGAPDALDEVTRPMFERAPAHAAMEVRSQPDPTSFQEDAGEPQIDGIPVSALATWKETWKEWVLASPVPERWLINLLLVGLVVSALPWLGLGVSIQGAKGPSEQVEPKQFKVEFQNESVSVARGSLGPHEKMSAYLEAGSAVIVSLTDGSGVKLTYAEGQTRYTNTFHAGPVSWVPASGLQRHENPGDTRLEFVVIQPKVGAGLR